MAIDVYLTRLVTLKAANDRLQEELDSARRVSEERAKQRDALITYKEELECLLREFLELQHKYVPDHWTEFGDLVERVNAVLQPNMAVSRR